MRTSVGFNATAAAVASPANTTAALASIPHSAWHSPVPYLFGGLAAMLGLIAFALLILACSYWKLSGFLEGSSDQAGEESAKPEESEEKPAPVKYEERIVVIMAGEEKPRYLATPICSRGSSFGDNSSSSSTTSGSTSSDLGRSTSSNGSDGEVDVKKVDEGLRSSQNHDNDDNADDNNNHQLNHATNEEQQ